MRILFKQLKDRIPKRTLGVIFVVLGILALVTPFTPGSWLVFVGLELLGMRYIFQKPLDKLLRKWRSRGNVQPSREYADTLDRDDNTK